MRSGLRPGHAVATMTCVSERSGIASRVVRESANSPSANAAATPASVNARRVAQKAMRRSITRASPVLERGGEARVGGDEEVARGHDALTTLHAAHDLDPAVSV